MAEFQIECFHNPYLPRGVDVMNAIVTVTATGTGTGTATSGQAGDSRRAELIVVDTSGSMKGPKLLAAKQATGVAVDCLPDGVRFAVLGGNHSAQVVYPPQPPLAVSSSETRSAAKAAVMKLEAGGGTAIGTWIELAAMLLRDEPGIRHAILLTDGKNESEQPEAFERRLWDAKGSFQCDCRGVGKDWSVAELRSVATALVGTYDIVATPDGLAADFSRMLRDSLSRQVGEVALRVWTPQGGQVLVLKQMDPLLELTDNRVEVDPLAPTMPLGPGETKPATTTFRCVSPWPTRRGWPPASSS